MNLTDSLTKAKALGMLKHGAPAEDVAAELLLPLALVEEWENSMTQKDRVKAVSEQVGPGIVAKMITGEVVSGNLPLEELESKLQQAALKLTQEVIDNSIISFDLERARTMQLLGATMATLYNSFFNKGGTSVQILNNNAPGQQPLSRFIQKA